MSPTAPQIQTPDATPAQTPTVPHQALYRRWRAQTFSEIVGQTAVVETLRNAVRVGRVSHAILFVGPRGTGKTSLARILAKALNCTNLQDGDACDLCEACVSIREGRALDLIEIDAASNRGIGDIRDLRERIQYAPTDLRRKVYILDEAHQITKEAWNALLKSLEEPPDFVAFIFASTHPQGFPPAILSRLQRYDVRRLTIEEIEGKLGRILTAESVTAEPGAIHLIARLAAGGMRDAESILDQVLASAGGRIDEAAVRDLLGLADVDAVGRLAAALVDGDAGAGIAVLAELDERGRDVAVVLDQILDQLRSELTGAIGPAGDPDRARALSAAAHRLGAIDPERRGVGGLRFQLELALLDAATRPRPIGEPVRATTAPPGTSAARRPKSVPDGGDARGPEPARHSAPPAPDADTSSAPDAKAADPAAPVAEARAVAAIDDAPPAEPTGAPSEQAHPRPAPTRRSPTPSAVDAAPPRLEPAPATAAPSATSPAVVGPASPPAMGPSSAGPATPPVAGPATPPGIDELRAAWPEIVAVLSQSPPVKPLIAACRPVSLEGAVVTLGFPEDQAFLKDALERRRAMLEDGIGRILGRAVAVHCVSTNLEHVPVVPLGEAADLISEARRIFADDLVDVGEVS